MALLTICQHTFQNVQAYDDALEDLESLKVNVHECYSEITKTSEQIQSAVRGMDMTAPLEALIADTLRKLAAAQ